MHRTVLLLSALTALLTACGDLPAGHVPVQPTAQEGGGAAYLRAKGSAGYASP